MIHDKHSEFIDLCRSYKVDKVYAFGSLITDRFDPVNSDMEVLKLAEKFVTNEESINAIPKVSE